MGCIASVQQARSAESSVSTDEVRRTRRSSLNKAAARGKAASSAGTASPNGVDNLRDGRSDGLTLDDKSSDPYITEDMMAALSERSKASGASKEEVLEGWVCQIPKGQPQLDPLKEHQKSMEVLRKVQAEKTAAAIRRKEKSKSKSSKRRSSVQ